MAGEERAELIVVGARLNGRQPRPPLRSRVATELVRMTPIPVVVVPPGLRTPGPARESFAVPVDGAGPERPPLGLSTMGA